MSAPCWLAVGQKDVTRCRCVRVQRKTWKVRLDGFERAGVVRNCCCWSQTDELAACVNCGSKGLPSCGLAVPRGISHWSDLRKRRRRLRARLASRDLDIRPSRSSTEQQSPCSPQPSQVGDAATAPPVPQHPGDEECPDEWVQVQAPTISGLRPMSPLRLPGDRGLAPSVAMSSPTFRFVSAVDERTSTWVSLIT